MRVGVGGGACWGKAGGDVSRLISLLTKALHLKDTAFVIR